METNGFLLLMPLMFAILFSERIYRGLADEGPLTGLDRTDSLMAWLAARQGKTEPNALDCVAFRFFDPNRVHREELVAFGLNQRIADRIIRYREKGGRFRKKEDVAKIYGMDSAWMRKAVVWMTFPVQEQRTTAFRAGQKVRTREDINRADTLQLQDVYGIGPALARRIVTFRDRLGGYVVMEQLRDVYGLDSIVVERVRKQFEVRPGFVPRRINLRLATYEELDHHPYISRRQAQAIVAYRRQHDGLDSLGQLLEIRFLDEPWLSKIRPYVFVR